MISSFLERSIVIRERQMLMRISRSLRRQLNMNVTHPSGVWLSMLFWMIASLTVGRAVSQPWNRTAHLRLPVIWSVLTITIASNPLFLRLAQDTRLKE